MHPHSQADERTTLQLNDDRCMPAAAKHGNCVAASLSAQLVRTREADPIEAADMVAMLGVSNGLSTGCALIRRGRT